MGSWFKNVSNFHVLLAIIAIVIVGLGYYIFKSKQTEGFAVTQERIDWQKDSKRMYNDYSNMFASNKPTIIPRGPDGDPYLKSLLATPSYQGNSKSKNMAGLNYNTEFPYASPPDNSELIQRIKMCESVKEWNCEAFDNPDFQKYCGICTKEGEDHNGKAHFGGLYIDPYVQEQTLKEANSMGKKPVYYPTAGVCKSEFLVGRPYCDVQKDRDDCSKIMDFKTEGASKCALCAESQDGNFVYTGSRGGKDSNYALKDGPISFTARLRLAVTHPAEATIKIVNEMTKAEVKGSFINGTNTYICDIPNVKENDKISISIRYPEYIDHPFTSEDMDRINNLAKPKKAMLTKAMYGPIDLDNYERIDSLGPQIMRDDPRAADVTPYVKANYMKECSSEKITANNAKLGGDPAPGIPKGLRLDFESENTNETTTRYTIENDSSQSWLSQNWNSLCPTPLTLIDAESQVCETDADGKLIEERIYTNGKNNTYYGASKTAKCIQKKAPTPRALVGIWESLGSVKRTVPLSKSVYEINGFAVTSAGVPIHGTVKNSRLFRTIAPASVVVGIPNQLFWFWSKDETQTFCTFSLQVPATLRDPAQIDDIKLCPSGPLLSTVEGSKRLVAGPCERPINGTDQGPGNYSMSCVQSLFLNSGCTQNGQAYPNNAEKLALLLRNPKTGEDNDIDAIESNIDELYTIATTTRNSSGIQVDDETLGDASMKCLGKVVFNPCDTVNKESGPLSVSCLNYLFRNAGKEDDNIGATYPGAVNRRSGTGRPSKAPVLYCQTSGSMSPIGSDGNVNLDAVAQANSYGGVDGVREFYRQIHSDANFSANPVKQRLGLSQCYGVNVQLGTKASELLRENSSILIVPQNASGSAITISTGGEITTQMRASGGGNNVFIVQKGFKQGTFMFKDRNSDRWLRVQGFRVRASENDNTETYKQEVSFKVVKSLSANQTHISLESVYKPGSYLALAENKGVYISPASSFEQQKACSWMIAEV